MNTPKHQRRTKVLFFLENLGGGGAEKVLTTIARYLDRALYEVTVCCIQDTGVYIQTIKETADHYVALVPNISELKGWKRFWAKKKRLLIHKWLPASWVYRLFVPKQHDVEIAFLEGAPTRILSASTNNSARKIAWIHIDLRLLNPLAHFIPSHQGQKKTLSKFDDIVGVSKTVSDSIRELYSFNEVLTIYNPLDAKDIHLQAEQKNIQLPEKKQQFRLISVGRYVPQKAFDRLLRSVKRLLNDGISLELWLVGDGALRPEYEQWISDNHLEDFVTLWGFQSNPYTFIKNSDLFVCSSFVEGYNIAISEALILGIPVLTTNFTPDEHTARENLCIIVDNDEEALYQGLKSLLSNPLHLESQRELVKNGRGIFDTAEAMKPITSLLLPRIPD